MGITLALKNIAPSSMLCSETAQVTLSLSGSGSITANPVDIMLVLDRSGSMNDRTSADPGAPTKIVALKAAANDFVHIIANASTTPPPTPPDNSPTIQNSSMGVVSFASTATLDLALNQTVATIQTAINALTANGETNHADAFNTATAALAASTHPKYIIMITDGMSTAGGVPPQTDVEAANAAALAARNAGIIIYCIGLGQNIPAGNLINWAGNQDRVLIAPSTDDLQAAFAALAANIINPAPQNIVVTDTVHDNFEIVGPITTTTLPGVIIDYAVTNANKTITWKLSSLGLTAPETASITFGVQYTGDISGIFPVNKTTTYVDSTTKDPSTVVFVPNITTIDLTCDNIVNPNCDYPCITAPVPCCGGVVDINAPSTSTAYEILCDGTLLNLNIRFKNVCPNRKLAIGAIVCETVSGVQQPSIYRITSVNTPNNTSTSPCRCQDFTVPLEVLLPPPTTGSSCAQRQVKIRIIAHYIADTSTPCSKCSQTTII